MGLKIDAPRPRGGFSYMHPPTGFRFEMVRDDSSDEEDGGVGGLVFNPLSFGTAEEVCSSQELLDFPNTSCSASLVQRMVSLPLGAQSPRLQKRCVMNSIIG